MAIRHLESQLASRGSKRSMERPDPDDPAPDPDAPATDPDDPAPDPTDPAPDPNDPALDPDVYPATRATSTAASDSTAA